MIRILNIISQYSRILHLGHDMADCDTAGSAYALSRLTGGDLGFYGSLKISAHNLLEELNAKYFIAPDLNEYDFIWLHDIGDIRLVGDHAPSTDYGIIDHHPPDLNALIPGSKCTIVEKKQSTTCITYDLLKKSGLPLDKKVLTALAAGLITDTGMLYRATSESMGILTEILSQAEISPGTIFNILSRCPSKELLKDFIEVIKNLNYYFIGNFLAVSVIAGNHDDAFSIADLLLPKGVDVCMAAFPETPEKSTLRVFFSKEATKRIKKLELFLKASRGKKKADIWAGGMRAECTPDEILKSFEEQVINCLQQFEKGDDEDKLL